MKHECFSCLAQFDVSFEDNDYQVVYCPNCGQLLSTEIDLVDEIDPKLLYDEFDD